jgi:hypothetical protein
VTLLLFVGTAMIAAWLFTFVSMFKVLNQYVANVKLVLFEWGMTLYDFGLFQVYEFDLGMLVLCLSLYMFRMLVGS